MDQIDKKLEALMKQFEEYKAARERTDQDIMKSVEHELNAMTAKFEHLSKSDEGSYKIVIRKLKKELEASKDEARKLQESNDQLEKDFASTRETIKKYEVLTEKLKYEISIQAIELNECKDR